MIEIVLAVGIISFALIGILGLFPVALDSAEASRNETHAAFIARSIFNDLSARPPFLVEGRTETSLTTKPVNLAATNATGETFEYNEEGELIDSQSTGSQGSGSEIFVATVRWEADTPAPGLTRVEVNVHTPPDAPETSPVRDDYFFVSLVRPD